MNIVSWAIETILTELAVLFKVIKFLLPAVPSTIKITLVAFFLAFVLGLIVALIRLSHWPLFQKISRAYVDVIRGVPLLVQIFFIYFGLGKIFRLEQFLAGVVAIGICYSAYLGEIIRAGIQAIPQGQYDASKSLGMTSFQTMRFVILPQSLRIVLAPIANEFIACLKDSSLVSIIGLRELTRAGREFYSGTFRDFETWFIVGFIYLILTAICSKISHTIEKRYRIQ